jgi:Rrf2 family transcriptional regulator, iron-sulfur cluster assembly transcription factor
MISKSGIHAINALSALAGLAPEAYRGTADLAEQIDAPRNYLGKLLKMLAEHGLLDSQKGKGGGFRLARPPEDVSLYDVIEPIDHVSRWDGCFLGQSRCSGEASCAAHIVGAKSAACTCSSFGKPRLPIWRRKMPLRNTILSTLTRRQSNETK